MSVLPSRVGDKSPAHKGRKRKLQLFAGVGAIIAVAIIVVVVVIPSGGSAVLAIPALKPPVVAATPTTLYAEVTGRRLSALCTGGSSDGPDCKTAIEIVKERLFSSGGPTDFIGRLNTVDERMQALIRRNAETATGRKCVGEAPQAWAPTFTGISLATTPTYHFSCEEDMNEGSSGGLRVYFGIKSNVSYIAEIQQDSSGGFNGAILAHTSADAVGSTSVLDTHIVQITSMDASTSGWLEIYANPGGDQLEVAFATNEQGTTGIGCGVRLKRVGARIFVEGKFADSNCPSTASTAVCVDADSLAEVAASECTAISTFERVTTLDDAAAAAGASSAYSLVQNYGDLPAMSLTGFNVGA